MSFSCGLTGVYRRLPPAGASTVLGKLPSCSWDSVSPSLVLGIQCPPRPAPTLDIARFCPVSTPSTLLLPLQVCHQTAERLSSRVGAPPGINPQLGSVRSIPLVRRGSLHHDECGGHAEDSAVAQESSKCADHQCPFAWPFHLRACVGGHVGGAVRNKDVFPRSQI